MHMKKIILPAIFLASSLAFMACGGNASNSNSCSNTDSTACTEAVAKGCENSGCARTECDGTKCDGAKCDGAKCDGAKCDSTACCQKAENGTPQEGCGECPNSK